MSSPEHSNSASIDARIAASLRGPWISFADWMAAEATDDPGGLCELIQCHQARAWERGERPLVERYLEHCPSVAADPVGLVDVIYAEMCLAEEFGEAVDLQAYQVRFPQVATELERQWFVHFRLADLELSSTDCDPAVSQTSVADSRPTTVATPSIVPGVELVELLGRGGMGVVYRGRQPALNRDVAVKFLSDAAMADSRQRQRFQLEAEAIARLRHQHIVQLYDSGIADGRPYLVMEYVSGSTLAHWQQSSRRTPRAAAELVAQLADAMQVAHKAGIVHRDLKPANVLIDQQGEPRIADFGLTKMMTNEIGISSNGEILGTPAYMAPEQATSRLDEHGPASDIFSLGCILYELLTDTPPFSGVTPLQILTAVAQDDPPPPTQVNSSIPRDLSTICLKCLQKQPSQRYASMEVLAADLRRFLQGKPVLARPITTLERGIRWCRRNPLPLALVIVLTVDLVSISYFAKLARDREVTASERKQDADVQRILVSARSEQLAVANNQLRQSLYAAEMSAAWEAARQGRVEEAIDRLNAWVPAPGETTDLRGAEWYFTWNLCHDGFVAERAYPRAVDALAVSSDGRTVAASTAGSITLWDLEQGAVRHRLSGYTSGEVAFDPSGQRLYGLLVGQGIGVWDVATGQRAQLHRFTNPDDAPTVLDLSPRGDYLAIGHLPGQTFQVLPGSPWLSSRWS